MEIPIELGRTIPLEFYICRKKQYKKKIEEYSYFKNLLGISNTKHFRPSESNKNAFIIMSEHDEIANQLIDQNVGNILTNYMDSGILQEIHITDHKTYNDRQLFLRAELRLPGQDQKEVLNQIL